jgi:hypothetical protein
MNYTPKALPFPHYLAVALYRARSGKGKVIMSATHLALFLLQIHLLVDMAVNNPDRAKKVCLTSRLENGRLWICSSMMDWQRIFPFWDARTIRRLHFELVWLGLVLTEVEGERDQQRTWYTLDYEAIDALQVFLPEDDLQKLQQEESSHFGPEQRREFDLNGAPKDIWPAEDRPLFVERDV